MQVLQAIMRGIAVETAKIVTISKQLCNLRPALPAGRKAWQAFLRVR